MCRRRNLKKMCDFKIILKAALYDGVQNGSHGEKEKSRESKAKDTMVETEVDKLSRSI